MSQWISVEDRWPENHAHCIIWDGFGMQEAIYHEAEKAFYVYDYCEPDVIKDATHWMLFPEPPNKIDENKTRNANYLPLTTRADRIRSMTDEQMAKELIDMIADLCEDGVPCYDLALEWFRKPVEDVEA